MNIKIKLSVLLLFVMSISCEEYLKEEPKTLISATNFWKTASDARTGVDGVYESFHTGYSRWWINIDNYTDDQVSINGGNKYTDSFGQHTVKATDIIFATAVYTDWWVGIARANLVLKYVPSITMDENEKNVIFGEARALRALFYFNLVKTYGDMPLITDGVITAAEFNKPRVSAERIYDEIIIPDLLFAENNCKDVLHTGRITKWTAKLMLADVYMTRAGWRRNSQGDLIQGDASNWALARDKAKEVIDNSPHSLNTVARTNGANITPAYGVAWLYDKPFTSESILEISYIPTLGLGNWSSRESNPAASGINYWGATNNTQPLVTEVPSIAGNLNKETTANPTGLFFKGGPPANGYYIPTPDLYDAFETGDQRRDYSLMTRYITPEGRNYLCQPTFRKLVDIQYYLGAEGTSFQYTTNNVILYRYADALLIYAEAQNEADGVPSPAAYDAVNKIRKRAFGVTDNSKDLSGLTPDAFRTAVWKERRCEFNAEFKRKFDLVRTNRLVTETTNINLRWTAAQGSKTDYTNCYTYFYNNRPAWPDNEWLWPIPQTELELNKVNGWYQNKGY